MTVFVDSGFRRGTDILKALALGADCVLLGRPFLFAAALAGEAGVEHAIKLLRKEIDTDLALLGVADVDEVTPEILLPVGVGRHAGGPAGDGGLISCPARGEGCAGGTGTSRGGRARSARRPRHRDEARPDRGTPAARVPPPSRASP